MSARLEALLVGEGSLPTAAVRAATERQRVYGGALDTALLELGVISEPALWARLAMATGLPVPPPNLSDGSSAAIPPLLSAAETVRLRAVPVGETEGQLMFVCSEPVEADAIRGAAADHGYGARLYIVPEIRLIALRQRLYGEPLTGRYAALLARTVGTTNARTGYASPAREESRLRRPPPAPGHRAPAGLDNAADGASPCGPSSSSFWGMDWELSEPVLDSSLEVEVELHGAEPASLMSDEHLDAPTHLRVISAEPASDAERSGQVEPSLDESSAPMSINDSATEALCRRARDTSDRGRPLALRALRLRRDQPSVRFLLAEWRAIAEARTPAAVEAMHALGEVRDEGAIPLLLDLLEAAPSPEIEAAAHRALVALAAQDHGRSAARWRTWWRDNAARNRVEWLLDSLGHREPELRRAAAEELRHLSGESFGYLFDLPRRQRKRARDRWAAWWHESVRGQRDKGDARLRS